SRAPIHHKSELLAEQRILVVCAAHHQRSGSRAEFKESSCLSTEVFSFDVHNYAARLGGVREFGRNVVFSRFPFAHLFTSIVCNSKLEPQFTQSGMVIRTPPERPVIFALWFRKVVCCSSNYVSQCHLARLMVAEPMMLVWSKARINAAVPKNHWLLRHFWAHCSLPNGKQVSRQQDH